MNDFVERRVMLDEAAAGARPEARDFLEQYSVNDIVEGRVMLSEPVAGARLEARNFRSSTA